MKELKRYKAELVVIALLSVVLLAMRWVSATVWPTTGQYDLAAQTETIFWTVLRLVIYSLAAWLGLRAVAPKAYQHLKHDIIDQFDRLPAEQRRGYSLRIYAILFFGLVLLALSGCSPASAATPAAVDQRTCVVMNAAADVGVREASGHNDGPEVECYLAHVGLGVGHPWCAAFVSYQLSTCGVSNPRSAWSPAFAIEKDQVWTPRKASRSPRPGDVFSVWFGHLGRVGHVGLVSGLDGKYITTIEGNTSGPGSREGDGVYARRRQLSKVHAITNYIQEDAGGLGAAAVPAGANGSAQWLQAAKEPGGASLRFAGRADGFRRAAARYPATGATCPCAGEPALAQAGHGPAAYHGAQQQGLEHRADHQWHTASQRWLRQPGAGRYVVRPLAAYAKGQYQGADTLRDQGGDRDAQVGVVGTGHCILPGAAAAVAAAAPLHQSPALR